MVGKNQLEIGVQEFLKGVSTSDYIPDGGYSPDNSYNVNPLIRKGILSPTATPTDLSTNIGDNIIAHANQNIASEVLMVGDTGKFYKFTTPSTAPTNPLSGAATTTYIPAVTDAVFWAGQYLVTRGGNVAKINSAISTLDETWWTGTKGKTALSNTLPHPLHIFERICWVADGRYLHTISEASAIVEQQLDLGPRAQINATGTDPGTGLMLIATTEQAAGFAPGWPPITSSSFVYLYDGYSSKPRQQIPVESPVSCFITVGSTVFVGYGANNLGIWNGNGITFLRKLDFNPGSSATATDSLFKHKVVAEDNYLYFVDGNKVMGYGEVMARTPKTFFPVWTQNVSGSNSISALLPVTDTTGGYKQLAVGFTGASSAKKFYTIQPWSSSAGTGQVQSNRINFPRPVYIRRVRVFTTGLVTGQTLGTLTGFTENGSTDAFISAASITNSSGATRYVFDFDAGNKLLNTLQLQLAWTNATANNGITRIMVYYDVAE